MGWERVSKGGRTVFTPQNKAATNKLEGATSSGIETPGLIEEVVGRGLSLTGVS